MVTMIRTSETTLLTTLESTEVLTQVDGVPVRVWKATTESGLECVAYVARLAVHQDADARELERELQEIPPPGVRPLWETLDPRML